QGECTGPCGDEQEQYTHRHAEAPRVGSAPRGSLFVDDAASQCAVVLPGQCLDHHIVEPPGRDGPLTHSDARRNDAHGIELWGWVALRHPHARARVYAAQGRLDCDTRTRTR